MWWNWSEIYYCIPFFSWKAHWPKTLQGVLFVNKTSWVGWGVIPILGLGQHHLFTHSTNTECLLCAGPLSSPAGKMITQIHTTSALAEFT